jgi:N-glycosylase/DNA lyase
MEGIEKLKESYELKKDMIKNRLKEFEVMIERPDEDIFAELSFCLCTPQSKAKLCDLAVKSMQKNNILYRGDSKDLKPFLNTVRFGNTKAERIVKARDLFTKDGKLEIKDKVFSFNSPDELREWLVENVNGLGMKEASHFLRNIGLGTGFAILDRHVLKNLRSFGVVGEVKSMTKKRYLKIENEMQEFSKKVGIPMEDLDLLFWSKGTGEVFK